MPADVALDPSRPDRARTLAYRVIGMGGYHVIALLAFLPYFFTWSGVVACFIGFFVVAMLGINIGYHRLLSHRTVSCSKPFERVLATLGVLNGQLGPLAWVAIHRRHHQFTDTPQDPHSPSPGAGSFLKAHIGWIFQLDANTDPVALAPRYAKDLLADPYYAWLEKDHHWFWVALVPPIALFFFVGFLGEMLLGSGATAEAGRVGLSLVVWGVVVRTVIGWHVTWSVNSVTHIWGYRRYDTSDDSRNNPFVGILALGEGWHNNHHAFPNTCCHSHKWWELDPTWVVVRILAAFGLLKIR